MEANKRIDAGIKRGPRTTRNPSERLRAPFAGPIPPDLSPDTVLERYLTEETTSQIAHSYGTSRKTLVRWLVDQRPKEWKQVQIIRALCRKESADEDMEGASDALSLARAREMLKSGQWDLERLDSTNYGQKQEVSLSVQPLSDVDRKLLGSAQDLLTLFRDRQEKVVSVEPEKLNEIKE